MLVFFENVLNVTRFGATRILREEYAVKVR